MARNTPPPMPSNRGVAFVDKVGGIRNEWLRWLQRTASAISDIYTGGLLFIQPTAPNVDTGQKYQWIQTGLGDSGNDFTFWFEDGE